MVSWSVVEGATKYEYIIDNGDVKETTSNNINLYKGSFISVRAIGEGNYLSSRWSRPTYQIEQIKTSNNIFLYYYGIDRPATKLDVGDKANRPINNPVKPNYIFDDWYVDITYKTKFNFDTPLTKNTVVYAKFIYDNSVKYSLYKANLTTKVGDFEVSHQYEYNEYKISFDVSAINEQFYVVGVDGSKYGPYVISEVGPHRMYFSPDHKWDINTSNERNAYWCLETNTYYFSNNLDVLKYQTIYLSF